MSEQTSNPTSGQNVPKSKFRRKSRQEQTAASKLRMERRCEKVDAAREKLAKQKPPKKPGAVKRLAHTAGHGFHGFVHGKLYEVEHENVGTEGAHRSELAAESVYRFGRRKLRKAIREHPAKAVERAESKHIKATADYYYRKTVEEHPEMQEGGAVSRYLQKQKIKRQYAKQAREAARQTAKAAEGTASVTGKLTEKVSAYIKEHPGGLLLLLAALTMRCHRAVGRREFGRGVLLGMTAGLTFAVRFQMGFALLGYGIWLLVFHRRRKLYAGMVPGVLVVLALGMLTDRWLYGEWTLTPVNYLRENILNENMLKFGTSPWWYYFTEPFTEGGYVYGPLALVAAVWFFWRRPRHVVTWMLVPFLLVHFFLGHKELRFFFPVLFFAPWFIVPRAAPQVVRGPGLALRAGSARRGQRGHHGLLPGTAPSGDLFLQDDAGVLPRQKGGRGPRTGSHGRRIRVYRGYFGTRPHRGDPVLHAPEPAAALFRHAGGARSGGSRVAGPGPAADGAFALLVAGHRTVPAAEKSPLAPLSRLAGALFQFQRLDALRRPLYGCLGGGTDGRGRSGSRLTTVSPARAAAP